MATEFVVTDEEGAISFDSKGEKNETFKTMKAASERARELAKTAPGASIRIYQMVAECKAAVSAPTITQTR